MPLQGSNGVYGRAAFSTIKMSRNRASGFFYSHFAFLHHRYKKISTLLVLTMPLKYKGLLQLYALSVVNFAYDRGNNGAIELDIPAQASDDVSRPIQPGFVGLACETSSFPAYSGN